MRAIVNLKNIFGIMENEAKEFVAKNEELNNLKIVEILLINSFPMRILTRGYLQINKPKTKTIIVESIDELIEQLKNMSPHIHGVNELNDYLIGTIK